jgi:hypothetical protein
MRDTGLLKDEAGQTRTLLPASHLRHDGNVAGWR